MQRPFTPSPHSCSPILDDVNGCFSISRQLFSCVTRELRFHKFDGNIVDNFSVHRRRHFWVALAGKNWITSSVYDFPLHQPSVEGASRRFYRLSLLTEILVGLIELQGRDTAHVFNLWMRMKQVRRWPIINVHVRLHFQIPRTSQDEFLHGGLCAGWRCRLTLVAQVPLERWLVRLL